MAENGSHKLRPCIKCDFFYSLTAELRHLPNNKHSFYYAADGDLLQQQTAVNCQLKFMQPASTTFPSLAPSSQSRPEHFQLGVTTAAATLESILIMCTRKKQIMTSGVAQKWHRQHGRAHFRFGFLSIVCQIALRVCSWRPENAGKWYRLRPSHIRFVLPSVGRFC